MEITNKITPKIKVNNAPLWERTYKFSKLVSKDKIKDEVEKFQNELKSKGKNVQMMLSVNIPNIGFRSSKSFNVNDIANYVDKYDWSETDQFVIYTWSNNTSSAVGSSSDNNDCLFEAIKSLIGIYRCPKNAKSDTEFKQLLSLKEKDKVPLSRIPYVERIFKVNIHISGDYIYTSNCKYNQTIYLNAIGEHIEPIDGNNKPKTLLKHIPCKEQKLVVCRTVKGENIVRCYDGKHLFTLNVDEYYKRTQDFFGEEVYINQLPIDTTGDIIKDYENYIYECELIKEITHSRIDLAKCGFKITNQVLKLIHYDLISYNEPEQLTPTEEYWIFHCFKGALIFSREAEIKHAYNYDVKSAYPSVLCDEHFSFPVKQGVFKIIDKLPEDYLTYGIYRCCISKCNNELIDRLFRFNNMHYYTHTDIYVAKKLGLDITLIQDGQANYLCYSEGLANGSKYFRQLCYTLYQLKNQSCNSACGRGENGAHPVVLAKRLINVIWGALCTRNKIKRTTINEDIHFKNGENIIDIQPLGDDYKVSYLKTGQYFKFPYARLGVFLTSTMRKRMMEYILPNNENIYRCHTDSILSDIPLANLPKNDWMGNFKLDKEGNCKIENCRDVFWG